MFFYLPPRRSKIELPFDKFLDKESFDHVVESKKPDVIRLNNPYFHFAYALNDKYASPDLLDRLTIESCLNLSEQLCTLIQQTHRIKLDDIAVVGLNKVMNDLLSKYTPE